MIDNNNISNMCYASCNQCIHVVDVLQKQNYRFWQIWPILHMIRSIMNIWGNLM